VVAQDDVGRPVLEWRVDPRATSRADSDPNARTYDFLKRLEVPDLEILDDAEPARASRARNPYDNSAGATFRKPRR
jgi:hypothetical protein